MQIQIATKMLHLHINGKLSLLLLLMIKLFSLEVERNKICVRHSPGHSKET